MEITKPNKASDILVMKFGGTSVGSPDAMRTVAEIVEHEKKYWKGVIPVVSALNGVTNLLLETAQKAAAGDSRLLMPIRRNCGPGTRQ
jgi:aspartokinase